MNRKQRREEQAKGRRSYRFCHCPPNRLGSSLSYRDREWCVRCGAFRLQYDAWNELEPQDSESWLKPIALALLGLFGLTLIVAAVCTLGGIR